MNKITKIWVLWVALCSLLVALHTSAATQTWAIQKLQLQLTAADNSCTMVDYDFGSFQVSGVDQRTAEKTGLVLCSLTKKPAVNLSLQLNDLSNGEGSNIPANKFTWSLVDVSANWTLPQPTEKINQAFPIAAYSKNVKEVWVWSGTLKISWVIPGWTPDGTYTWELNLLLQSGNN